MSWQDSFVPSQEAAPQMQGWQSSFIPSSSEGTNANDNSSTAEKITRSLGLTGRDLAGAIPMGLGSIGDLANKGINAVTSAVNNNAGTNIPQLGMPTDDVQKIMSSTGIFPEYENEAQKEVGNVASFLFSGGEGLVNTAREAYANALDMLPKAAEEVAPGAGVVVPKSGDIKLIKEKLDLAGVTPQQYANALMKSSANDFAGELGGDPLRMQTQVQAKITSPSMQPAREAMRQRLETAPQRVQQIIEKTFYPSTAAEATTGGDIGLMKGAASPSFAPVQKLQENLADIQVKLSELYGDAEAETVPRGPFLDIINTPNGQTAMKGVIEKLANKNIKPESAGIVINPESGFYGLHTKDIPASTINELSKSLGDLVKRNPMTGAIEDSSSLVAEEQRKHITSYLSENSPAFSKANANAAANLQGQSAFEAGRKLAHSAAGENADALMDRASDIFSPQELSYHKAGYAQGLADAIQKTPLGGGNPAAQIAKGTVQNVTSNILQSPTEAQKFADLLVQEKNRIDLAQRGLGGSNTAETLNATLPEIPTSAHGMIAGAANKVMDFVNAGKNERIAQLLYATSPEQKAILARKILQ